MISSRIYTAASHDSLKPLFSRQNFLQLSAFRKMESEKRRGGSFYSKGRRPPFSCYSPRSSQSASYGSSMYQKDEPSISPSDIKDNGNCHIGGCRHERVVGEESQDSYSSSRPKRSPFAQDSYNSLNSASYEGQKDKPSIATSDVNDNGRSHIGRHEHERKVGEGSRDRYSISRPRHSPSAQDSPNSHKSASYEGQKDKPSIATSDVNDNGRSHIGGREHERKVGEGSQDGYSISRPRHSPSAQDSPNSHKSASDANSMYQKDEPSISASNTKDNGHCDKGGHQHERMVGEESQDGYSSSRCSPSVEDSSNPCESASYEGPMYQKDESSIATSDVNDSRIGGRQHERKVGEGSQVRHSIPIPRDSLSTQDSPNSHKSGSKSVRIGTSPTSEENNFTEKGMETGFDICARKTTAPVKLNPSLFLKNREKRKEREKQKEQEEMGKGHQIKQLRSGMILLKKYLGHGEQVEIIKECRRLGLGEGGFYQPGYSDGAKLHLQMMCLGKDWDPENKYRDRRLVDGAEPPSIPDGFKTMVKRSLHDSHDFIGQDSKVSSVEDILPNMKPDLCIVNFYTDKGKLGLHQDKDESPDSLHKRLPVVSFSIGDSAEFLYGDDRFADKAEKVTLESGDVLIFGGESRHIFHGVSSILTGTAPNLLVEDTNLRPGRLNLTFRQY